MGVPKLVFALVSTAHQAAPGSVQLSAFLLNVINCLGVGLNETFCCLPKRVHLRRGGEERSEGLKNSVI